MRGSRSNSWRKTSASMMNGHCVEVAVTRHPVRSLTRTGTRITGVTASVGVSDTALPAFSRPVIAVPAAAWGDFLTRIRAGDVL